MKINTKLIITLLLVILLPIVLMILCYLVLMYGFGFVFFETITRNGQTFITISKESFISSITVFICVEILSAIVLSNWLRISIFKPLDQLKKAIYNIKAGDLETEVVKPPKGEYEDIFNDFEMMRINLRESSIQRDLAEKQNRELVANISHDLKTPITSIRGYVEGIMDGVADTDEKMDRYIKTIYNKANAMNALINELTVYSKLDESQVKYNFEGILVEGYFGDCAEEMTFDLEEQGINFQYLNSVAPGTAVLADQEQLSKVIHNIISNSIKYRDPAVASFIRLYLKDAGDYVQVDIKDNGLGIPESDTKKIFDRFYRSDASRNSAKGGSGIGLSIAQKIIEDHGGQIWATVEDNKGLTMHFTLRKYSGTMGVESKDKE